ncbi:hypothetical protein Btru_068331 [Bulinus truncatus]|nr:hypothetical protein Btru_068331 [Bulinus truncatus]
MTMVPVFLVLFVLAPVWGQTWTRDKFGLFINVCHNYQKCMSQIPEVYVTNTRSIQTATNLITQDPAEQGK